MINLLPPKEKEKIALEMVKRKVIILWFLVLFFLVCLILILFSVKIYSQSQIESQKLVLAEAKKELEHSEIRELETKVNSANLIFTKLNSFYQEKIYFSEILEKISKIIPPGISLNNFSSQLSSVGEEKVIKVSLSGFAKTRENLFEFKQILEKEPGFKEISFPPQNWVKPADIDFSVTFTITD